MQKKITNSFGVVALSLFPLQSPELSKGFAVCFLSLPSYDYLLYYNPVNIPLFIHPVNIYSHRRSYVGVGSGPPLPS